MKRLLTFLFIIILTGCIAYSADSIDVLPVMKSESKVSNKVWVGTFQLVWNDLMNELVKGDVKFDGGTPKIAKELNVQEFQADMLSENSYYKTVGKATPELKTEIENAIKEKFNETSDILDSIKWGSDKYLFYAMLKKDFRFIYPFDKLKNEKFGKNHKKVAYFGINKESKKYVRDNADVMFYDSPQKFAIKLKTQTNDIVYLYRTDENKNFTKLYAEMMKKSTLYSEQKFMINDELKIPEISFYVEKSFSELKNKKIKHTDITIDDAIETIDFKMNNEGVELKSEASIPMTMSMPLINKQPRHFYFNDTFIIFLQEKDKSLPYFALRVYDVESLNNLVKK